MVQQPIGSPQYLDFIGTFFGYLPLEDKNRLAELWKGYEQCFAATYQKFVEVNLDVAVQDLIPYETERWLNYTFANPTFSAATFVSTQDLSVPVNTTSTYLIKFSINGADPIEVNIQGVTPSATTISEIISAINTAVGFIFATTAFEGTVVQLTSNTSDASSSIEFLVPSNTALDATGLIFGLSEAELPALFPEFPYVYNLPYPNVASIPTLQDHIRDQSVTITLTSGTDYITNQAAATISFLVQPISLMWAKQTLLDNQTPWNNFGSLMDIYEPNTPQYLTVVQGLWYALWNGPTPNNVQTALYLLFGLPVALEATTVTTVTGSTITTTDPTGIIRNFTIPPNLVATVTLGQVLTKYTPLVSGINVYDKTNNPGFIANLVGRAGIQQFLTPSATKGPGPNTDETMALRMLEEHCILPQISVNAFISPNINLGNVKIFLQKIKPLIDIFLLQVVVGNFLDPIDIADSLDMSINMDVTPTIDLNQTTLLDPTTLLEYETEDMDGFNLDSDGVCFQETVEVLVYTASVLTSDFTV